MRWPDLIEPKPRPGLGERLRRAGRVAFVVAVGWLGYVAFVLRPSNQRDWEFGMDRLARITIDGDSVLVRDVRDFRYTAAGTRSTDYVERAFDVSRIERVWFIHEPFTVGFLPGFRGVAHTYFVFDFQDRPPLAVSVEARREKGETYDAVWGLFNQFELIYTWGSEQDVTVRRAVVGRNELYMYPLRIPLEAARALFLQLARVTQQLESRPRFYNTLTSNCTNELAKTANAVKPGSIPPNRALVFPGYSPELLHGLGFIPNDVPLDELNRRAYITDIVQEHYEDEDFSGRLRSELEKRGISGGVAP